VARCRPSGEQLGARKLAKATGTPLYVMKAGRIVNLNPNARTKKETA